MTGASEPAALRRGGSRTLGFWMCTALVVGNIIGIGIFAMPSSLAPYGLNAIAGWIVNIVGCALLALSFAALSRAFPADDGPYQYTMRAFGRGTAFIVMWSYWVSTCVGDAAIAIGVVGYVAVFVPALARTAGLSGLVAQAMIWTFVLVNLLGARTAGWVQIVTTALKLLPQAAVIALGVWVLLAHPAFYSAHVPPNPFSWGEVNTVSAIALFAMLGIECAMIPAGRVRDPARTIPRATLAGTFVTGFIYIAISVVPIFLIPQKDLSASNAPYADLFARVLGGHYGDLIALFVIVSGVGVLNGWTLIAGETAQAMGRHGGFPQALSRENRAGAPAGALIFSGAVTSVLLLANYSDSVQKVFTLLIVIATAATLPLYFCSALGLILLRRRGELPAAAGSTALMLVAAAAVIYCVWVAVGAGTEPLLWAVALCGAGLPLHLWSSAARRRAGLLGSAAG
ncbi:MAG: amino acid permease [Gammaproteobacteria bacterium]|nr:amino acid permease [Gammaproteobacteria bacterium]